MKEVIIAALFYLTISKIAKCLERIVMVQNIYYIPISEMKKENID
jgi:hypothetical protein